MGEVNRKDFLKGMPNLSGIIKDDTNIVLKDETDPSTVATPTGGGTLFISAGSFQFKGSGGTVTELAGA